MTAPPVKKAKLNCASKLRFNTAEQAIANMAFSAEKWGVDVVGVYVCPECKGYHMTNSCANRCQFKWCGGVIFQRSYVDGKKEWILW